MLEGHGGFLRRAIEVGRRVGNIAQQLTVYLTRSRLVQVSAPSTINKKDKKKV